MRILVLDDMEFRHKWFRMATIGCVRDHTYTSEQAIDKLKENTFDTIFLDHDLDEEDQGTMAFHLMDDSGYEVVKWMVENKNNPQAQIIIHSCNPAGSKRMLDLLIENGYNAQSVPYPDLKNRMRI